MIRIKGLLCFFSIGILGISIAQGPSAPPPPAWSAGMFVVTDSQPYREADGYVRVLPFVSYRSRQVEWYGPFLRYRPFPKDPLGFRLRAQWDFGAYEEKDSRFLQGMGDRKDTMLLGVGMERALNRSWSVQLSSDRDVLGRHDGTETVLSLQRRFGSPFAPISASLSAGVRHQDRKWTADRVGVSPAQARDDRPAYAPDSSLHPFISGLVLYRIHDRWMASVGVRYERLDDSWRDSPLVSDRGKLSSIWTISYSF